MNKLVNWKGQYYAANKNKFMQLELKILTTYYYLLSNSKIS